MNINLVNSSELFDLGDGADISMYVGMLIEGNR